MSLVDDIYAALENDEAFAALLPKLSELIGARSCTLHFYDQQGQVADFHTTYYSKEMVDYYLAAQMYRYDPWREPAEKSLNQIVRSQDLITDERYRNSVFYNELYRRFGDDTGRMIGGVFTHRNGVVTLGLHRSISARDFTMEDALLLEGALPHLRRLYDMRGMIVGAERKRRLLESILDGSGAAILLTDHAGQIVYANGPAEALLRQGHGLRVQKGRLQASQTTADAELQAVIQSAVRRSGPLGGTVVIPAGQDRSPLRCSVMPFTRQHLTFALITIEDPDANAGRTAAHLIQVYGLTAAEAQTVLAIVSGKTPAETARLRQVALSTVRTQLASAMRKTGANSLTRLVRLVSTLQAPLGA